MRQPQTAQHATGLKNKGDNFSFGYFKQDCRTHATRLEFFMRNAAATDCATCNRTQKQGDAISFGCRKHHCRTVLIVRMQQNSNFSRECGSHRLSSMQQESESALRCSFFFYSAAWTHRRSWLRGRPGCCEVTHWFPSQT